MFNQDAFHQFTLKQKVIGFFDQPITLKSGRQSHFYVNWRPVTSDVYALDQLTDFILDFLDTLPLSFDCLYGVPDGATKLGLISQFKLAKRSHSFKQGSHILPMGRSKVKQHGAHEDRFFVGSPKGDVIVIEDVTTSGISLLDTLEHLSKCDGLRVVGAIGLTNRMERRKDGLTVEEAIKESYNIDYVAMSQANDLLPLVFDQQDISPDIQQQIIAEFNQYGVVPLSLPA